jgi:eukaryotic-like serine/threonine-protein kinase
MNADQLWRMLLEESIDQKYHLKKFLGAGGYGGVFLADEVVDDDFQRQVAVKLISPESDPKKREQQRKELKNAVNLKHPNLLDCFVPGLCQIKGSEFFYLVMELAEETLEQHLQTGTLSATEVMEIVKAIASALAYLHNGSPPKVHRDVKPGNLLRVGNRWKLADLGLLTAIGSQSSAFTSNRRATIKYAPPEAYQGVVATAWDIWSLGVMTAEMLTGELPFPGETEALLMNQVMNDPPSIDWSKVPAPFVKIIEGCLEKDRAKRHTAQRVLDKLVGPPPPPPTFTFKTVTVNKKGTIIQRETKQARYFTEDLGNGVTFDMVYIPGGTFGMGSPETEAENYDDEKPQHQVTIQPFYMGKYAATQAQWKAVAQLPKIERDIDPDPSYFKGDNRPVENVLWLDVVEFCARLSQKTGRNYRLPSEAQWEYACRAGTETPFHFGETITTDLANYDGNYTYANAPKGKYRQETVDVGSYPPNAFGLYEMHGNVWEWCADPWHSNYQGAPTDGSVWDEKENDNRYQNSVDLLVMSRNDDRSRLLRGGSWYIAPRYSRSALRNYYAPDTRNYHFGFRFVCVAAWTK